MDPNPPATSSEFYILKQGEMFGPFSEEQLREGLDEGHFTVEDFAQAEGHADWFPLGRMLGGGDIDMRGAVAPDWISILKWAWFRLRYNLDEQSFPAGWACLAGGAVSLALSRWPFVFWLPWFGAAVVASVALLRRKQESHGAVLLVAVVCIPLLFFIVSPKTSTVERPERELASSATPQPAMRAPQPSETKGTTQTPSAVALDPASQSAPPTAPPIIAESSTATVPVTPRYGIVPPESPAPATSPDKAAGNAGNRSAPTPIPVPPPVPETAKAEEIDFVQGHGDSLVLVKGDEGSGSGFICNNGKATLLYTNIHVIADIKQPVITDLLGATVSPGAADVAAGRDIARFELSKLPPKPLEIITEFDKNVRIGDDVVVLGNSGGGGVVTKLAGAIVGIGPDRIEVSAEFIPGNSGSPIIHVKTGKVVGIATYLTRRYEEFSRSSPGGTPAPQRTPAPAGPPNQRPATPAPGKLGAEVVRRFGYRIDNNARWETLRWADFKQDAQTMAQISTLSEDIFDFLRALQSHSQPNFATETLRRPATEWMASTKTKHLSDADQASATRGFLNSLRALVRGDVATAEQRLQYTYFRDELKQEREVRDKLYKFFDRESANLSSPNSQPTSYRKSR